MIGISVYVRTPPPPTLNFDMTPKYFYVYSIKKMNNPVKYITLKYFLAHPEFNFELRYIHICILVIICDAAFLPNNCLYYIKRTKSISQPINDIVSK